MKNEKLQKVLARAGFASRRTIEQWIEAGRIVINDRLAKVGERVASRDKIYLDNKLLENLFESQPTRVIIYNKLIGEICTRSDSESRKTVFQNLPPIRDGRWINIGRLDVNTSGLLLFTNNGELANQLMHPSYHNEREYAVRITGRVTPEIIKKLVSGVVLEDGKARFEDIADAGGEGVNHWFHVVVVEGRNRLVRRLWESQGLQVSRLKRVRFGSIFLPKTLRRGAWAELPADQIGELTQKRNG